MSIARETEDHHVQSARRNGRSHRSNPAELCATVFGHHRFVADDCSRAERRFEASLMPLRLVRGKVCRERNSRNAAITKCHRLRGRPTPSPPLVGISSRLSPFRLCPGRAKLLLSREQDHAFPGLQQVPVLSGLCDRGRGVRNQSDSPTPIPKMTFSTGAPGSAGASSSRDLIWFVKAEGPASELNFSSNPSIICASYIDALPTNSPMFSYQPVENHGISARQKCPAHFFQ